MGLMTRTTIEFNFSVALAQAAEIEALADKIDKLATQKFEGSLQGVSAGWKGESSVRFLAKGQKLERNITVTAAELRNVAKEIRRIAKQLRDADLRAMEIAQS